MAVKLLYNGIPQFFTAQAQAQPLSGGKLFHYLAGTTTKQTVYQDSAGVTPWSNPIILGADGRPSAEIWGTVGIAYKEVLTNSTDTDPPSSPIWTADSITSINDVSDIDATTEWTLFAGVPTYTSATTFTLVGDQRSIFTVNRRVWGVNTGGSSYSNILSSVFAGGITTVTLLNDSTTLDAGLSAVSYGIINGANTSAPAYSTKNFRLVDFTDQTKQVNVDASTVTTGTTSTLHVSPANVVEGVQGANVTSASTINLDTATGNYVHITGGTNITLITLSQGRVRNVVFDSILTIGNSSNILLPGANNINTQAGDCAIFAGEGSGVVRCTSYMRRSQYVWPSFRTITVLASGSGTYTTPSQVSCLDVQLLGGGGGGAALNTNNGATGTTSTFGSLTAGGGVGGTTGNVAGTGGLGTGGDINLSGGAGEAGFVISITSPGNSAKGGSGGASLFGPGAWGTNTTGLNANVNSGGGGSGATDNSTTANAGGGGGGYCRKLILSPSATYSYVVGGGGNGGAAGGVAGGNGGSGIIIIDEFYN